jgi:hypothetical protein
MADFRDELDDLDAFPVTPFPANMVHVIRTAQAIHVSLSQMADQKANMLLAATFVVFTISLGQAHGGPAQVSLVILAVSAFLSAVFAILTVMPATRFPTGGKLNLLFFGSYHQIPEAEYLDRIIDTVKNEEAAFRMMARDMYQNGVVMARKKYRLLGYAYRIFLAGLTLSFLAFVVEIGLPLLTGSSPR